MLTPRRVGGEPGIGSEVAELEGVTQGDEFLVALGSHAHPTICSPVEPVQGPDAELLVVEGAGSDHRTVGSTDDMPEMHHGGVELRVLKVLAMSVPPATEQGHQNAHGA